MNKDAVKNIGVGNLQAMNRRRFDDGGYVDNQRQPREAARVNLAAPSSSNDLFHPSEAPNIAKNMQDLVNSWGGGTNQGPAWQSYADKIAAKRNLGSQEQIAQAGGSAPGLGQAAERAWNQGIDPNAGLPAGTSGYLGTSGQPVGNIPGTGPAISPGAAGAIGGLASGLAQAAQQYAQSVKPWQMQSDAVAQQRFGSSVAQSRPAATFTQPQAQNSGQQNPSDEYYRLRMMGLV
jgi:hypothetical protein